MARKIIITLEAADVFQIINALESRAEAYEKTAALMKGEYHIGRDSEENLELSDEDSFDQYFIAELCRDASEAEEIAKHFRDIIESLEKQIGKNSSQTLENLNK